MEGNDNNGQQQQTTTQGIATAANPNGIPAQEQQQQQQQQQEQKPANEQQQQQVQQQQQQQEQAKPDPSKPLTVDVPPIVPVQFEASGNPTVDIVNDFFGSKGIGPDSAEYQAALQGDFTALEAKLKGMGDAAKGYERYINSAKQELQNARAANEAKHGKTITECHSMAQEVGGWEALSEWVRTTADASELAEINEALAAGGMAARQVTRYLVDLRKQNPDKADPARKAPVKENASTVKDTTGGALTAVQFQHEIGKLMDKFGTNYVYQQEYKDLCARRQSSRG